MLKEEQSAAIKRVLSMSAIKSNLPQMEEDEEDEIVDEIWEEESDQAMMGLKKKIF